MKDCEFYDTYDAGGRACFTHDILTDREIACERAELEKIQRMMEERCESA